MLLLSLLFRLIDDLAALLAGADVLAIDFLMCNAGGLAAGGADEHDLASMQGCFLHQDTALGCFLVRFRVTLHLVDALDDNLALLRHSLGNLALLALILAGQYNDRIALLDVQFYE